MPDRLMEILTAGAARQISLETYPAFVEGFRREAEGKLSEAEIAAILGEVKANLDRDDA